MPIDRMRLPNDVQCDREVYRVLAAAAGSSARASDCPIRPVAHRTRRCVNGTAAGTGPQTPDDRHELPDRLVGQERRTADQHDQGERPHPQAKPDPDVQDDRPGQHDRTPERLPDQTQNEISQTTETWLIRLISHGCHAIHVMSSDWYSRLANARHIASPLHHEGPCSFDTPANR